MCADIPQTREGSACGRVQAVNPPHIYCIDISGAASFFLSQSLIVSIGGLPEPGDIVQIDFICHNTIIEATAIHLLQKASLDPQVNLDSLYYRLHRKERRLHSILTLKQHYMRAVRHFFEKIGFLELHTPCLVTSPGVERFIEPFVSSYKDQNGCSIPCYLPVSPEFALKRALSAGLEKIFEIKKVFRNNGELSVLHCPEFFMLEWYRAYDTLERLITDCVDLLGEVARVLLQSTRLKWQGNECDLEQITMVTVKECFAAEGIDLDLYSDDPSRFCEVVCEALQIQKGILTRDDLFFKFFLNRIEPCLGFDHPVVVTQYPLAMSTLCQPVENDPRYAQRFELFIFGIEIANAYGELRDPQEQRKRFEDVLEERHDLGLTDLELPEHFLRSLEEGIPPAAGIALGLDRLFMLISDSPSIADTQLYPFLDIPEQD